MSYSSRINESDDNEQSLNENDQSTAAALHKTYMDLLACGINSTGLLCNTPSCILTDEEPTSEKSNIQENILVHSSRQNINLQESSSPIASTFTDVVPSMESKNQSDYNDKYNQKMIHIATPNTQSQSPSKRKDYISKKQEQTSYMIETDSEEEGPVINCNIFRRLREMMRIQRKLIHNSHSYSSKDKCKKSSGQVYKIHLDRTKSNCLPEKLIFDLVNEQIPEQNENQFKKSKNKSKSKGYFKNKEQNTIIKNKNVHQISTLNNEKEFERIQIYYFDHGNSGYYQTTDPPLPFINEHVIDQTDHYVTLFWSGVFGYLHVPLAFAIIFIVQLFRFILASLIRPLIIGFFQISSDYFFKPILASFFNSLIQPLLILAYNGMTSLHDLLIPISNGLGLFTRELARVLRAIRLIEVTYSHCPLPLEETNISPCKREEKTSPGVLTNRQLSNKSQD